MAKAAVASSRTRRATPAATRPRISRFGWLDIRSERAASLARFLPEKGKIIMAHATKNVAIIALATAFLLYQGWLIWDMISP
jgi:hypothetical protein